MSIPIIKIPKPNIGKYNPGYLVELLADIDMASAIDMANGPEYLYFDQLKPHLDDISPERFWAIVKLQRKYSARPIPPLNFNERNFMLGNLFSHNELLYKLDNGPELKGELLDEVVNSAAIENKGVKILAAKKFILEAAHAKTEAEKLVKFTHKLYSQLLAQEKLEFVPERFRNEDERFVYAPHNRELICYIAPSGKIFEREWVRFLAFANDELEHNFMHPVVKAVILHFWALILSPLPTNSGVFARAVQYWYLQKHGVTLPISQYIKADLVGYTNAISYAAQDDNDFTYFLDFILRKIKLAAAEIENKKDDFGNKILPGLQRSTGLNARQAGLVYELSKSKNNRTNFSAYMAGNKISRKTAADDLKMLEKRGYLEPQKIGKHVFYYAGKQAIDLFV